MTRKLLTHAFWVIMGCYWVSVVVTDTYSGANPALALRATPASQSMAVPASIGAKD